MPAFRNLFALSLAGVALTATLALPVSAQTYPEDPVGKPDAARPGAIPMFKPPLYPPPKYTPPAKGTQTGNQVWIYPGNYGGGTTVIINNNYPGGYYPGYYTGYPGVYYPGNTVEVTTYPGMGTRSVAPVVVNSNNAVLATESAELRAALTDMTRAWERRDTAALGRHLAPDLSIAVLENERFRVTLQPNQAASYLSSVLNAVNTLSYRVYDVRYDKNGAAYLYANHRFRTAGSRQTQTATVRSTLAYVDGRWSLTAISVAPGILPKEGSQDSGIDAARDREANSTVSRP